MIAILSFTSATAMVTKWHVPTIFKISNVNTQVWQLNNFIPFAHSIMPHECSLVPHN